VRKEMANASVAMPIVDPTPRGVWCPEFRPTRDEFASFIKYMRTVVEPQCKGVGMCKVACAGASSVVPNHLTDQQVAACLRHRSSRRPGGSSGRTSWTPSRMRWRGPWGSTWPARRGSSTSTSSSARP
jgi:hypothetical protein